MVRKFGFFASSPVSRSTEPSQGRFDNNPGGGRCETGPDLGILASVRFEAMIEDVAVNISRNLLSGEVNYN